MKLKLLTLSFLFILFNFNAKASHVMGGELTYRWLDSTLVEFTYRFFRDCAGVSAPNYVDVYASSASCNFNQTFTLPLVSGSGQQINMTCSSAMGFTTCQNVNGYLPGVQEYVYKQVMYLSQLACLDWEFEVVVFA